MLTPQVQSRISALFTPGHGYVPSLIALQKIVPDVCETAFPASMR